jgi:hypothetical protein
LAVVPDLVVFEVLQGSGIEPGDFVTEGFLQSGESLGTV